MNIRIRAPLLNTKVRALVSATVIITPSGPECNEAPRVEVKMKRYLNPNREQERQESVVVFYSDAVVDPWAVMVKPFNALVADSAMPRAGRPNDLTFWAQVCGIDIP